MNTFYSDAKHIQILISLLKAHNVKKVVASPGTTNICLVASLQQDDFFEIYSSVDERSAAYIACGLASDSGEPVALTCTEATASRNYFPGLTEAFYRKLPILAITSCHSEKNVGHNFPQVIDRSIQPIDTVKSSVSVRQTNSLDDEWECIININRALIELTKDGGGPVHINLESTTSKNYSVKNLPEIKAIKRINLKDNLPDLKEGKIAIFVGAHKVWTKELTETVDLFCEKYNAVVICDHTSNYKGKYKILPGVVAKQVSYDSPCSKMDILIHIGDVSGAYYRLLPKQVWRVNIDGEIRDTFKKLTYVFQMDEIDFFKSYIQDMNYDCANGMTYYSEWKKEIELFNKKINELPFSNIWVAKNTIGKLPNNSVLCLGILNSLRSWNFFEMDSSITCYANTGGFGIDGGISSFIGVSLLNQERLCFCVTGDLSFFYDMNVLGNRHIGKNVRLMIINNGRGQEFRNTTNAGAQFGDDADCYISAAFHYGNKSSTLIKNYVESLGYEYLTAHDETEYLNNISRFVSPEIGDKSIVFEVFTDTEMETKALDSVYNLASSADRVVKQAVKDALGKKGTAILKKVINKN